MQHVVVLDLLVRIEMKPALPALLLRQRVGQSGWLSRVFGVGPQVGFIIPISTTTQGYLNIKGYKEFENQNRPDGWNVWLTFVLSPAEQMPSAPPRRMATRSRHSLRSPTITWTRTSL
jgi:hypothetical protein